jgi:hypothetical protein
MLNASNSCRTLLHAFKVIRKNGKECVGDGQCAERRLVSTTVKLPTSRLDVAGACAYASAFRTVHAYMSTFMPKNAMRGNAGPYT